VRTEARLKSYHLGARENKFTRQIPILVPGVPCANKEVARWNCRDNAFPSYAMLLKSQPSRLQCKQHNLIWASPKSSHRWTNFCVFCPIQQTTVGSSLMLQTPTAEGMVSITKVGPHSLSLLAGTVALAVENIIVAEHRNRLGLMSHSPNALRIAGATGGEVELVEIRRLNCSPTGRAWA